MLVIQVMFSIFTSPRILQLSSWSSLLRILCACNSATTSSFSFFTSSFYSRHSSHILLNFFFDSSPSKSLLLCSRESSFTSHSLASCEFSVSPLLGHATHSPQIASPSTSPSRSSSLTISKSVTIELLSRSHLTVMYLYAREECGALFFSGGGGGPQCWSAIRHGRVSPSHLKATQGGSGWEEQKKKGTPARRIECTQHKRHARCLILMPTTGHGTSYVSTDCDVPVCEKGEREEVWRTFFFSGGSAGVRSGKGRLVPPRVDHHNPGVLAVSPPSHSG